MAKFTNFENNLVNQFNYLSHRFSTTDDKDEKAVIRGKLTVLKDIIKEYADIQKLTVWLDYDENNVMKIGLQKA